MPILTLDEIKEIAPSVTADKPFRQVSSRYSFLDTKDVINEFKNNDWNVSKVSELRPRNKERVGFQKHLVSFQPSNLRFPDFSGEIRPEIHFINSHDATKAGKFFAGVYRFVCANGMVIGESLLPELKFRHTGDISQAVNVVKGYAQNFEKVLGSVAGFKATEMNDAGRFEFAKQAASIKYNGEEHTMRTGELLNVHRKDDWGSDLWTVFNRVQENLMKGGVNLDTTSKRKTKSKVMKNIDEVVRVNRELWDLAENFRSN